MPHYSLCPQEGGTLLGGLKKNLSGHNQDAQRVSALATRSGLQNLPSSAPSARLTPLDLSSSRGQPSHLGRGQGTAPARRTSRSWLGRGCGGSRGGSCQVNSSDAHRSGEHGSPLLNLLPPSTIGSSKAQRDKIHIQA